ncbi:MAG: SCP2 sterol-binding domain-containing protein [Gammaproteobacteria bacterium]|nr:SCP2 sterol-binding domain-containing protein [Gammaproteobacteria bacterium]
MNPLDALLRPLVALVNRQIAMSTPARELCGELAGSVIAVQVTNTAIAMYFRVLDDTILLSADYEQEPDAIISGSLLSLASLAGGEAAIRRGDVELRGDAELAQSFRKLLRLARPDIEEEMSTYIGDAPAHGIGQVARRIGRWGRDATSTMGQNISEYLQEESRALPSRNEVDAFRHDVDTLRDDVARLDARLRLAESRATDER